MLIHKNDGIYIKDVRYHVNIKNKKCYIDSWSSDYVYIDKQNPEWIIKNFYKSTKIIINAIKINKTSYSCIVIYIKNNAQISNKSKN